MTTKREWEGRRDFLRTRADDLDTQAVDLNKRAAEFRRLADKIDEDHRINPVLDAAGNPVPYGGMSADQLADALVRNGHS